MNKDKLIEEMLKAEGERSNTVDLNAYGCGLIDMYDRLIKLCNLPVVINCTDLEPDFIEGLNTLVDTQIKPTKKRF